MLLQKSARTPQQKKLAMLRSTKTSKSAHDQEKEEKQQQKEKEKERQREREKQKRQKRPCPKDEIDFDGEFEADDNVDAFDAALCRGCSMDEYEDWEDELEAKYASEEHWPYGRDRPCKECCKLADKSLRRLRATYHPDHILKAFDCKKGAVDKTKLEEWALMSLSQVHKYFLSRCKPKEDETKTKGKKTKYSGRDDL